MSEQFNLAFNLLDESFDSGETGNYGLALLLSETSISFCTLDIRRNKFLGLHQIVRKAPNPGEKLSNTAPSFGEFLTSAGDTFPWMKYQFRMVKIGFEGEKSTLVPAALYDPGENDRYLNFNFAQNRDDEIRSDHLLPLDAWQVYTLPHSALVATAGLFPGSRVIHASSLLIESVWLNYKNRINAVHVFLHVRGQHFDLMIFDGRQMSYYNSFPFQSPEDVTYYLIFVLEQLNYNPETIPLILLGNIEAVEGLSELLLRYVRHVETGQRNEAYRYSYILNKLPHHAFFPLLNFFSCGL
ncbi:MAG: DUF3822 family protein [bacterium]